MTSEPNFLVENGVFFTGIFCSEMACFGQKFLPAIFCCKCVKHAILTQTWPLTFHFVIENNIHFITAESRRCRTLSHHDQSTKAHHIPNRDASHSQKQSRFTSTGEPHSPYHSHSGPHYHNWCKSSFNICMFSSVIFLRHGRNRYPTVGR